MADNQLADDIRATRDVIARKGWCQGFLESTDGRVCLMGAWSLGIVGIDVADRHSRACALETFLTEAIAAELGMTVDQLRIEAEDHDNLNAVPYYNDYKLSDQRDVLNFLDKQAIRAEEKA